MMGASRKNRLPVSAAASGDPSLPRALHTALTNLNRPNETRRSTRAKDFCNVVWKVHDNSRIGSLSPLAGKGTVGPRRLLP
jgi:hypothetical protein